MSEDIVDLTVKVTCRRIVQPVQIPRSESDVGKPLNFEYKVTNTVSTSLANYWSRSKECHRVCLYNNKFIVSTPDSIFSYRI